VHHSTEFTCQRAPKTDYNDGGIDAIEELTFYNRSLGVNSYGGTRSRTVT